jgi:thymidylate kinase
METFIKYKNIDIKNVKLINNFVKCQTKKFDFDKITLHLNSYTLKLPSKKIFEDDVYADNPILLEVLPRACTIVTQQDKIIGSLEGPTKFSGKTTIDEDPDDEQEESSSKQIYDHNIVVSWANQHQLEVVGTEKANGKFAICRIFSYQSDTYILFGSKNNHFICQPTQIDDFICKNKNLDIICGILLDIKNNLDNLMTEQMLQIFNQGWSLAGEFCDGQHFTDGDNTISWFGFFKNGNSMDTNQSFTIISSNKLKTVPYHLVFNSDSEPNTLDQIFLSARCKNNEGAVLRCRNIISNQIILVKTKSVMYIVKRFMRQVLLRGYKEIESIRNRFIDAHTYHGLGTEASINVTNKLIQFGLWMMHKTYPVSVLGCIPINSIRGQLSNGFNTYWKQFINETSKSNEIIISPNDFGPFDKNIYLEKTQIYNKRNYSDPAIVVFLQGLQGSGKSTVANWVCEQLNSQGIKSAYIEQDIYWGDTNSCQGALYHLVANSLGPKVIIVSRCNANPTQYKRYIDVIHKLPSVVTFITPKSVDKLYLMVSLSGIINRSQQGDKLLVGRFEYPMEKVVEFTQKNYEEFVPQTKINIIHTHKDNSTLLTKAETCTSIQSICKFVQDNWIQLHNLRFGIDEIGQQIIDIIIKTISNKNTDLVLNPNSTYIGLAVSDLDRDKLMEMVNIHVNDKSYIWYAHHCTQIFLGQQKLPKNFTPINPGERVKATIDALVVRKSDNACAFRISQIVNNNNVEVEIKNSTPHITAKLPPTLKPMVSNSFVGLNDDSVKIIGFNYPLELTGFWA